MRTAILAMTSRRYEAISNHLFPGDELEAAAILVCNLGKGRLHNRLIVAEVLFPPHRLSNRKKDYVAWPFSDCLPPDKISDLEQAGQSIVTIHSHPKGYGGFSKTDNLNDRELFRSVCGWFDDKRPNGSAFMLPNGRIEARTVDIQGKFKTMPTVSVVGENIQFCKHQNRHRQTDYGQKLAQTFGTGTLETLRNMRVAVVGCSGTGSIVIELLVRNCVGELVLVDDDVVEEKNLNRLINGTLKDAQNRRPKVLAMKRAIQSIGLDTTITPCQGLTDSPEVIASLIDCDVIFGCVDSAFGRYHLDCLASAYLIPYFDVGVHLEADGNGGVVAADAVTHYVHPEGASLLSRGAYTMEQVTAENWRRDDPTHYNRQRVAGYLAAVGEEQPAVMSVNMQAACLAFNDFMARIHAFRLDDNREFETQRFRIVHGCYESHANQDKPHPLLKRYMESGDSSILVRNNTKHV